MPVQPEVWEEPIFGELGVLRTDGDRAECHICAGWYRLLGSHVFQAHGLYAYTYRRLFGLRQRTGLAGEALRAQRRHAARHLDQYREASQQFLLALTPEERSANSRQRVVALESRRDPVNRATWRRNVGRAAATQALLLQDPTYRARLARRVSEARGGRVVRICPVCGQAFELTRFRARAARCSCGRPACIRELRRQIGREVAARAEVRERVTAAARRRTGWPVREHVQHVPAGAWAALQEPDAALVRRFYGLPLQPHQELSQPQTLVGLAQTVGLQPGQLRRRLARLLEQLLDEPVVPPRPRGSSSCIVCRRPIVRSLGSDVRATCSAACLRAFRTELARTTLLRPQAQARSAASARRRVATPERRAAWRAQIRMARRQARPLLAELQALERARLDALAPDDREVLARYYGLDGEVPRTLTDVARERQVSKFRAAQQVRRAVALLLGPQAVPPELGGRARVPCALCGASVELSPSLARKAREHTCGPTCRAELARRRLGLKGLQDDPAVHERARQAIILRKGRPHADAIGALPPAAIERLAEPRRSLVRAYYGLDGTPVCSYQDLGPRFGLSAARVGDLVRDAVHQLLG